jgi:hypothetical protein
MRVKYREIFGLGIQPWILEEAIFRQGHPLVAEGKWSLGRAGEQGERRLYHGMTASSSDRGRLIFFENAGRVSPPPGSGQSGGAGAPFFHLFEVYD